MKTITSFKIAGLITACLFAAMPTKADIGAISFKTSAAGMNALETTIGSNQMTLETWLYIDNSTGFFASNMHNDKGFALGFDGWFKFQLEHLYGSILLLGKRTGLTSLVSPTEVR